ncbi:hypothetical protein MRB53_010562 [Persea americana]|uniref:Uncharacterized protein n=1 Tax=Persea americana TaxID=3435 RepID=A0ACC2LSE2_PERAE|nr:hypothetical protein MRB53_010562 [Persea americana]
MILEDEEFSPKLLVGSIKEKLYRQLATTTEYGWDFGTRWMRFIDAAICLETYKRRPKTRLIVSMFLSIPIQEREMDGYNENSPTMMKPGGFQEGIPMESRKFTEEKGNKRQALRDIKNFVGAPPPYPRAINKRRLPDKSALDDNNQQFAGHRPMTRKFPASLAEKQLSHQDDCDLEEIEMTDLDAEPVLDIDSSDFNNPLAVVDYVEDIYTYYRQTENLSSAN